MARKQPAFILYLYLEDFADYLQKTRNPIDGAAPLAILIALLPNQVEGYLLNYQTHAQEMGESGSSVSYAALVFSDPAAAPNESKKTLEVTPWEPADASDISLYGPTKPITGDDMAGRLASGPEKSANE